MLQVRIGPESGIWLMEAPGIDARVQPTICMLESIRGAFAGQDESSP